MITIIRIERSNLQTIDHRLPRPDTLDKPLENIAKPLKVRQIKVNLPTETHPHGVTQLENRNKGIMLRDEFLLDPARNGIRGSLPDRDGILARRRSPVDRDGKLHVSKWTLAQLTCCVGLPINSIFVKDLRTQDISNTVPRVIRKRIAVRHDRVLASTASFAELDGGWDAVVRRVVVCGDVVEEKLEGVEIGVWREHLSGVLKGPGEGLEAVGGWEASADEVLVALGDVDDCAAAGGEEPSVHRTK